MAPLTTVRREDQPGVLHITLTRPEVRNAFDEEVIAALTAIVRDAAKDPTLRAIVLAGSGPSFCAGADLAWMMKAVAYSRQENLRDAEDLARMLELFDCLPVPVIARVHGAALGGGVGLAAVCDIVVAAEDTMFAFTEVKLGILPAVISPYAIAKIGRSAARELFLTGARFSAARAMEIGLVHAIGEEQELDRIVAKYVNDLVTSGPEAVAAAKRLIAGISGATHTAATEYTIDAIAERRVSKEGQEGMSAFLAKRPPSWTA